MNDSTDTSDLIAEANKLLEGVTAGPWVEYPVERLGFAIGTPSDEETGEYPVGHVIHFPDAVFIARSRTLIPELVTEIMRLQGLQESDEVTEESVADSDESYELGKVAGWDELAHKIAELPQTDWGMGNAGIDAHSVYDILHGLDKDWIPLSSVPVPKAETKPLDPEPWFCPAINLHTAHSKCVYPVGAHEFDARPQYEQDRSKYVTAPKAEASEQ